MHACMHRWVIAASSGVARLASAAVVLLAVGCVPPGSPGSGPAAPGSEPAASERVCDGRAGCVDLDLRRARTRAPELRIAAALHRKACDDGSSAACVELGVQLVYGL